MHEPMLLDNSEILASLKPHYAIERKHENENTSPVTLERRIIGWLFIGRWLMVFNEDTEIITAAEISSFHN